MENYESELEVPARKYTVTDLKQKNSQTLYERGGNLSPTLSESEMCLIVEAGGGKYVGVMNEIPGIVESVVLFTSPRTRSTLALPSSRPTVAAVRQ
jgi:hypothetical protein